MAAALLFGGRDFVFQTRRDFIWVPAQRADNINVPNGMHIAMPLANSDANAVAAAVAVVGIMKRLMNVPDEMDQKA